MEIMSSLSKGMTNHPYKGCGFSHVTHFVCATVDLEKILSQHAVIGGINKIDDRLLLIAPTSVDATL